MGYVRQHNKADFSEPEAYTWGLGQSMTPVSKAFLDDISEEENIQPAGIVLDVSELDGAKQLFAASAALSAIAALAF